MCPVPLAAIDPKNFRKTFSLETRKVRLTQVDLTWPAKAKRKTGLNKTWLCGHNHP